MSRHECRQSRHGSCKSGATLRKTVPAMFRTMILSVPFAILPLVAVQLVETVLSKSLLPGLAGSMQRAVSGQGAEPAVTVAPDLPDLPAPQGIDAVTALRLTLRF